jgi:hypothetical protein
VNPSGSIVTLDTTCRRCGYNLRGLDEAGRCPECGTPIGLSTQGDLLRYADPLWLVRLRDGLWLMTAGALCVVFMQLQNFVLPLRMPFWMQPLVYFAFGLISISGAWLLTVADPAGLAEDQYVSTRKLIRITIVLGLAYRIFAFGANATSVSPDMRLLLTILAICFGFVSIAGFCLTCKYLAQLSDRIPRPGLVRFSRHLMWWYPFVHGPFYVLSAMLTVSPRLVAGTVLVPLVIMWQRYLYLALLLASVVLYLRLAKSVREQEQIARQRWSVAEGAVQA